MLGFLHDTLSTNNDTQSQRDFSLDADDLTASEFELHVQSRQNSKLFDKISKANQWKKGGFLNKCCWGNWMSIGKRKLTSAKTHMVHRN